MYIKYKNYKCPVYLNNKIFDRHSGRMSVKQKADFFLMANRREAVSHMRRTEIKKKTISQAMTSRARLRDSQPKERDINISLRV